MTRDAVATVGRQGTDEAEQGWQLDLYRVLRAAELRQMCYVPDAGHARLIRLLEEDPAVETSVVTTEEEGVAMVCGAWLGGQRSVLLMQSSGVGNCVNMLSLPVTYRIPFLTIVTMRGEWAEFVPHQIPMGQAVPGCLEMMGVKVLRVERAEDVAETVSAAATMAFDSDQQMAVLLSQRMIGRKQWPTK